MAQQIPRLLKKTIHLKRTAPLLPMWWKKIPARPPFLYDAPPTPGELLPMARVLTVDLNGEAVAYPYNLLQEVGVINDEVGGQSIAIFWMAGTASALDTGAIAQGRDVGAAAAFLREVDGEVLTFASQEGQITDAETGRA
ncbi:MAG: DUF3179 domain-containing protein [Anaerolineaceae bacterium]|nr:DUF3179 domain-containing protein [Anaerolineaceae bacterium]